jgi:hypothetical protein
MFGLSFASNHGGHSIREMCCLEISRSVHGCPNRPQASSVGQLICLIAYLVLAAAPKSLQIGEPECHHAARKHLYSFIIKGEHFRRHS